MKKMILGSNSPRRKELLQQVGFDFEVARLDVEEVVLPEWDILEVAEKLSLLKNNAYRKSFNDAIVITADTVVINDGELLGKPKSIEEACSMLECLQGGTHQVVSAVCISDSDRQVSFSDKVDVKMISLSSEEINHYVQKYHPLDKAGAYGVQEWIGMVGVEWIKGSYYTVVGLPIHKVYQCLKNDFSVSPFF